MVDENIVRKDLSFAEMAEVAQHYAADPSTGPTDVDAAVTELFQSAGYQKRSYIRAFARLMALVGRDLQYPQEVPRSLGLALLKQLEDDPGAVGRLRQLLAGWEGRSVADELGVLRRVASAEALDDDATPRAARRAVQGGRKPRTTFEIARDGRRVEMHRRGRPAGAADRPGLHRCRPPQARGGAALAARLAGLTSPRGRSRARQVWGSIPCFLARSNSILTELGCHLVRPRGYAPALPQDGRRCPEG